PRGPLRRILRSPAAVRQGLDGATLRDPAGAPALLPAAILPGREGAGDLPHLLPGRLDGPGTSVRGGDVVHHLAGYLAPGRRPVAAVGGGQLRGRLLRELSARADPGGGAAVRAG